MKTFEKRLISEFDVNNTWRHVEHLANNLPGRHAGSDDEKESAQYIAEQVKRAGLNPEIQAVDCWLGLPREAYLRIKEPVDLEIPCSSDTGHGEEISGEFLVIETPDEARQATESIKGKIVVMPYSYAYPMRPADVRKHGGAGVIYGNWGPSTADILRVTAPQTWTYWGLPEPEAYRLGEQEGIPQAHIGRQSYEQLREMCGAGRVTGTFKSTIESFWGRSHQVLVDVDPGHDDGRDDFMILAAHHDSWYPGASDDAAGVGVLIEAARVANIHRERLRRKLRFMFVSGHENGAYATSTWYIDNHWRELRERGVCFSFTDTPGFANAPEYKIEASEELIGFAERCARDIVGNEPVLNLHRANKTGDRGFFGLGIPSIYTRCAFTQAQAEEWGGAFLGYWNHSNHDTLDKIDKKALEVNGRIRLLEAVRLANANHLPYDFRPVLAGMRGRLERWQATNRYDVRGTLELLGTLEARIDSLHGDIAADRYAPTQADDALKRLSRAMTWVNYTYKGRYGQDVFGANVTQPLTIMNSIDELTYHELGSPMDLMLRAKIRREQNMVEDAYTQAVEIADRFL